MIKVFVGRLCVSDMAASKAGGRKRNSVLTAAVLLCCLLSSCSAGEKESAQYSRYDEVTISPRYIYSDYELGDTTVRIGVFAEGTDDYEVTLYIPNSEGSDRSFQLTGVYVNNYGCDYHLSETMCEDGRTAEAKLSIPKSEVKKSGHDRPYVIGGKLRLSTIDSAIDYEAAEFVFRPYGYLITRDDRIPYRPDDKKTLLNSEDYCIEYIGSTGVSEEDGGYTFELQVSNRTDKDVVFRVITAVEDETDDSGRSVMKGFDFYTAAYSYHPYVMIPVGWIDVDSHEGPFEFRVEILSADRKKVIWAEEYKMGTEN